MDDVRLLTSGYCYCTTYANSASDKTHTNTIHVCFGTCIKLYGSSEIVTDSILKKLLVSGFKQEYHRLTIVILQQTPSGGTDTQSYSVSLVFWLEAKHMIWCDQIIHVHYSSSIYIPIGFRCLLTFEVHYFVFSVTFCNIHLLLRIQMEGNTFMNTVNNWHHLLLSPSEIMIHQS